MNRDDIIRMAGHREVPPWVLKLVQDCIQAEREWVGLTLEEVEDIIKSNITITDPNLYEGVYAVAVDIELAVLEKNS